MNLTVGLLNNEIPLLRITLFSLNLFPVMSSTVLSIKAKRTKKPNEIPNEPLLFSLLTPQWQNDTFNHFHHYTHSQQNPLLFASLTLKRISTETIICPI